MDSTLLSKVELGQRMPTQKQTAALAGYFGVPVKELEAARIASKFWRDHAGNPAVGQAVQVIRESAAEYFVDKSVDKVAGRT